MINAHVEMDLNEHISVISSKVLELIQRADDAPVFESLMKKFLKENDRYTPNQFMDAAVLLYSIGCLDIEDYKVKLSHV